MNDLPIRSPHRRRMTRFFLLVTVGGLLVGLMLLCLYLVYSKPIGRGPAGPRVPREPFTQPWTNHKVLLLGLGDSVTAGFGVQRAYCYFDRLVANPEDEFDDVRGICLSAVLPKLSTNNMALSGSTSLMHLEMVRDRLKTQDADTFGLVVMTTGGNDLIHDYGRSPPREGAMYGAMFDQTKPWIENFEKRLDQMFDLLVAKFPGGCMVFVADIYDPTDGVGDGASAWLPDWPDGVKIHNAYNEVIRRCAARRPSIVHVVPMYEEFLGHGTHCTQPWRAHYRSNDPHYWYAWNLEDPNVRGYDAIRRLFLIEIAKQADRFRAL
jgi:lysophospholipase L1-like esterase